MLERRLVDTESNTAKTPAHPEVAGRRRIRLSRPSFTSRAGELVFHISILFLGFMSMPDNAPADQIPVSANNPCPFLRALVAGGYVDGHIVPLPKLTKTIEAATGEKGLKQKMVGLEIYPVALIANGPSPLRLLRGWWSGAVLDALRDGPLDKHGAGSRILDATAHVNMAELARLAEYGTVRPDPLGGEPECGLTAPEITTYMNANFERASGHRRPIDRLLMNGEWPVLLNVIGKCECEQRYLSVAEVKTLFVERRLPAPIVGR